MRARRGFKAAFVVAWAAGVVAFVAAVVFAIYAIGSVSDAFSR